MKSRLRALLLASAPALGLAAPAFAADVTDTRNTPIETATANAGAADNITVTGTGKIELSNGTAITLNSNNSVTNSGAITIADSDGAVGIRVLGGFTGSVTSTGTITINESYTRTDSDGDGTPDGPFAQGSGRTGILIEGPAAFTGDIANRGTIAVEGNNSRGIDLQTNLTGNFSQLGTLSVVGEDDIGVRLGGDVSGDVRLSGIVASVGAGATGVVVGGDVGGTVSNGGIISSTGFQYPQASNYVDPDELPEGFQPSPLDEDDLQDNGAALVIAGSISDGAGRGGFLNNGRVGGGEADDAEDGTDPTKDLKGDYDVNRTTGTISSTGSGPAVLISPDMSLASSGDIVIGLVVERVRDSLDDDDDDDVEEILTTFFEDYGFVNRGAITADGLNVGFDSRAVVITGSADGTRDTIIQGGILNTNTITSNAREADATTLTLGAGARLEPGPAGGASLITNTSTMRASITTEANHNVTVLLIEAGSLVAALENTGTMEAIARGDGANIVAIRDLSGTLVSIDNTGTIAARYSLDNEDQNNDGFTDDLAERTGEQIAIDLRTHVAGQNVVIVQSQAPATVDTDDDDDIDADDEIPPGILGDVLLGAGDDDVQLLAGAMVGDLSFGAGADELTIDGDATYAGQLSDDATGDLDVTVNDGQMALTKTTDVTVTTLTLNDQSVSSFGIDLRAGSTDNARIIADAISISAGAQITPQFVGIGSTVATDIEILRSETGLSLTGGQSIADNLALQIPFLFEAGLSSQPNGTAESVVVTVRRRSAEELGMSPNQAAAYESVVTALNADDALLVEVVNLDTSEEFYAAYNQLLPEFSLSALQFAVSSMDGTIGAVGNRLDTVRGGRDGQGAVWMQEFGMFLDRESSANDPGYRGSGFGMAFGMDRPLGPLYAVGLNVVGSANEIEQPGGFDNPLSVASGHIGGYAAANVGNLLLDVYGGVGADFFDGERRVMVGEVLRIATADWKGYHATANGRIAYDITMGRLFARPEVAVDWLRMDEESYSEEGGGSAVDLRLFERSTELMSTTASLTVGAQFGSVDRTWWSPRMRVGVRQEEYSTPGVTTAQFISGGDSFLLTADDLPESGGLVGFQFAAGSRWSSFALDYDADVREGFVRHGLRISFRFIF